MNHQETAKLLAVMNTVWKDNTGADADQQTIYYQMALDDVSYQDASDALRVCLKELEFFPKPVEIRRRLPRSAAALNAGVRPAPRSAYDLGYLPREAANDPFDLPGVPTIADIVTREEAVPRPTYAVLPAVAGVGE
jgi:hypothetical protein